MDSGIANILGLSADLPSAAVVYSRTYAAAIPFISSGEPSRSFSGEGEDLMMGSLCAKSRPFGEICYCSSTLCKDDVS